AVDDDGEPLLPSFYVDDLGVTDRTSRGVGDTTWPLSLAASRGERITRATLLARHRPAASLGDELEAVRETLSALTAREGRAYNGSLHARQRIELPRDVIAEAAPLAGVMSASQARMVAHCLYEHFGSKRLGLRELRAPAVDALVIGSVAHGVLAELGRCGFDDAMLDGLVAKWWKKEAPAALLDQPGTRFERDLLLSQLRDLAAAERTYLGAGEVRAIHFELAFGIGGEGSDPASMGEGYVIALPSGTSIDTSTLRGSIDRVDVITRDGQLYGVAIDYKTGKGESYRKEMDEMADFQLPIYCGVLPMFGIEPVGALYLGVASGERHGVMREDFADVFTLRDDRNVKKLSAVAFDSFMRERREALGVEIARVARGDLVVKPRKDDCKYCELRPVCRIGTFGVGGVGASDDD
ncbi:MAG TPA: PD-(D/E)XK nuclease family protein, partial [Gemmatimonadaceae bacterium]